MAAGKILNKRYEILNVLRIIDFITVYNAIDLNNREVVIVKELSSFFPDPIIKQQAMEQFKKYFKIYSKISHQNLAKYNDYFDYMGKHYIIMENFEGNTLKDTLEQFDGILEYDQLILWMIALCNLLSYLHNASPRPIIFKNITPDNIFLKEDGQLKLFNLGLPNIDEGYNKSSRDFYTYFLSPEQFKGKVDIRADIYSLGATFYYLLTANLPPEPLKLAISREIIPSPRSFIGEMPLDLEKLVLKSMSINVEDRYQSAEDMKRDLKNIYLNIIEARESMYDNKTDKVTFLQKALKKFIPVSPTVARKENLSNKILDINTVTDVGNEDSFYKKFGQSLTDIRPMRFKKIEEEKTTDTDKLAGEITFNRPFLATSEKLKALIELKRHERKKHSTLMLERVTSSLSTSDNINHPRSEIKISTKKDNSLKINETILSPHTILKERYMIVDVINVSSISIIYKGFDIKTNQYLMIKELIDNFSDLSTRHQAIDQFKMEAKILFKLIHSNLPKYQDYFDYDYKRYLIMEYIEGKDFITIINEVEGFIDEKQIVKWGLELCSVILYLHNMKPEPIIFRNLRPDNIILSDRGTLKLIDFGISKFFHKEQQTLEVAKIINPHFSPFEQYSGQTDERTDIYSLGAVMYFMSTKTKPADAIDINMEAAVLTPCRLFNPNLSVEFETVILKAMRMFKEHRHQTVEELRGELERLL
ncbi:MAG TPA: serine/threonine-protein kinase [Candidatus Eremiobacteraeota bacterium]|nr:serine/threonine-protein kinase [Candidatus Eremiobacteraeota bacterium]